MECSKIHLFSCCLPASWQLDRVLCLPVLRAWTSGPVYKNWSQSSDWEIPNTPIFRMWGAWSCSRAPLASRVSSCCADPAQGCRQSTCPFLHSILQQELPTAASHLGAFPHCFGSHCPRCARVPVKPSPRLRQEENVVLARDGLGFFVPLSLWSSPFGGWVPFGFIPLVWA